MRAADKTFATAPTQMVQPCYLIISLIRLHHNGTAFLSERRNGFVALLSGEYDKYHIKAF